MSDTHATGVTAAAKPAATIPSDQVVPAHGVSFGEAFKVWLRVALLSFGGPAGQIAVMHRIVVEERRWISESALPARAELLPPSARTRGAAARHLHRLADAPDARRPGGRRAVRRAGRHRPHGAQLDLRHLGRCELRAGLFFGLKAAVLAVVIEAVLRVGRRALKIAARRRDRRRGLHRSVLFRRAVPARRAGGGARSALSATGWATAVRRPRPAQRRRTTTCCGESMPDHAQPSLARAIKVVGDLAAAVARAGRAAVSVPRRRKHLHAARRVLQQGGGVQLRRRLCGAGLCRAAGRRDTITGCCPARC